MRVTVEYECGDVVYYARDAPNTEGSFVLTLEYPKDRRVLERLIADLPDKTLTISVESNKQLSYPRTSRGYKIPVKTVRRGGLARLLAMADGEERVVQIKPIRGDDDQKYSLKEILPLMLRERWISRSSTSGDYVYHEKYLGLLEAIRKVYSQTIGLGEKIRLPHVLNIEQLVKTGLCRSLPPECWLVSKFNNRCPQDNRAHLETFHVNAHMSAEELLPHTHLTECYLSHNCCMGLYPAIAEKNIIQLEKFTDLDSTSYRNEGGAANGRERLECFRRIETILVGAATSIEEDMSKIGDNIEQFLLKLGIDTRTLRVSPWYGTEEGNGGYTLDWEARDNTSNTWIEIINLTRAGTTFTKPYRIKSGKALAHSGCSGMGLERMATVFLMKHGLDFEDWPIAIKNTMANI